MVKESLKNDILNPVFNYGRWIDPTIDESKQIPFNFEVEIFFIGLNLRLDALLQHVQTCMDKYKNVLLD